MAFPGALETFKDQPALIDADGGEVWSYARLAAEADAFARRLGSRGKSLVFCFCRNDLASIAAYLGAARGGHAVGLFDAAARPEAKARLIEAYRPNFVVDGGKISARGGAERDAPLHPALGLLLSTSGTTGSPKLVRLSWDAVQVNASAIAEYLGLGPAERAVAVLPIHYSFGLSVLNSHLAAGGSLIFTQASPIRPEFWKAVDDHSGTSLSGVPYMYEILERVGFEKRAPPSLKTLTQAGGRMPPERILRFDAAMKARGGRLVVMYGQTEATARISYLPPSRLPAKAGSVGVAIPGGTLSVARDGEVVYRGPNVMMGYAESASDLGLGDELGGVLRTGDLGRFDADGDLFITGRLKRFAKIYGLRLNLDEIEDRLKSRGPTAVTSDDEKVFVFCAHGDSSSHEALRQELSDAYKLNPATFEFRRAAALPLTPSGKVDYEALKVIPHGS